MKQLRQVPETNSNNLDATFFTMWNAFQTTDKGAYNNSQRIITTVLDWN